MKGGMRERQTLGHIAALLVALAFLAERAAGRAFPVRFAVLAILWQAEAVARAFVVGATGGDRPFPGEPPAMCGGAFDAQILALRLRLLAAALDALANVDGDCPVSQADWSPCIDAAPRLPVFLVICVLEARCRPLTCLPHDTS